MSNDPATILRGDDPKAPYSASQWRDLLRPGLREKQGMWAPHRDGDIRAQDEVHGNYKGEPYHYDAKLYLTSYDRRTEVRVELDVNELNASRAADNGLPQVIAAFRKLFPSEIEAVRLVSDVADQIVALNNADPALPSKEQIEAVLRSAMVGWVKP